MLSARNYSDTHGEWQVRLLPYEDITHHENMMCIITQLLCILLSYLATYERYESSYLRLSFPLAEPTLLHSFRIRKLSYSSRFLLCNHWLISIDIIRGGPEISLSSTSCRSYQRENSQLSRVSVNIKISKSREIMTCVTVVRNVRRTFRALFWKKKKKKKWHDRVVLPVPLSCNTILTRNRLSA